LISPDQPPVLLLSQSAGAGVVGQVVNLSERQRVGQVENLPHNLRKADQGFQAGAVKSPVLLQAQAVDLDLDGWTDVVGLSAQGVPVLLHNKGGTLVHAAQALGSDADWPKDVRAVAVVDIDGDCFGDLLVWAEGT